MKSPPLRVLAPEAAHLAADGEAPYTVFLPRGGEHGPRFGAAVNRYREFGERPLVVVEETTEGRLVGSAGALRDFARILQAVGHPAGELLRRALAPLPTWRLRTHSLPLDRPHLMGIVNLTGDSFSGDGVGDSVRAAVQRAQELRQAGAVMVDVGGESARADRPVREEMDEARAVGAAIKALVAEGNLVSCDTYKPAVAAAALEAGAECLNDISGLTLGTAVAEQTADAGAAYVLNYSYSVPKKRPHPPPEYDDVVAETLAWMFERVGQLEALGLPREHVNRYITAAREAVFFLDPHICTKCHYRSTELLWQCPHCHEWNSFVEERIAPAKDAD